MADYGDILLEAVQTVVDGSLSKLAFDKTITAKIVDNSKAEKGEYIVNDGATSFLAYSENTEYEIDTNVYVNIPNGDFTKQKTITGKYLKNNGESYIYTTPWNNYIDITENLISDYNSVNSVRANDTRQEKSELFILQNYKIENGKDYEVLGLKADFKTLLNSLNVNSGTYGIRVYIRTVDKNNQKTGNSYKTYLAELSNLDMVGNVYSFESYYNQQKVFDISQYGEIYSISVSLFQKNDFQNQSGQAIAVSDIDNIFVKNIYVSLGYNLTNFDSDKVLLYTLDSATYAASYGDSGNENLKNLKLRWIHADESGEIIAYTDSLRIGEMARIHWYQYKLQTGLNDDLAGAFWEEIEEWQNTFEQNINCYDYINDPSVRFKVIIETPVQEYLLRDSSQSDEISQVEQDLAVAQANLENAEIMYASSSGTEEELILEAAQVQYDTLLEYYNTLIEPYIVDSNYYESEVLIFTNEDDVANLVTLDLIQALTLETDVDGYNGIYSLYNQSNQIQSSIESAKLRPIIASYSSLISGEESLDTAESITWQIPLTNTMIQAPEDGKEYDSEVDEVIYSEDGQYCTITRTGSDITGSLGEAFENTAVQYFRIKNYYQANATNNTITCYVDKNSKTYQASTDLVFGPLGNNGTDYTLLATMAHGKTCLYGSNDEDILEIDITLYDANNEEVINAGGNEITYSWFSRDTDEDKLYFCTEDGTEVLGYETYTPEVDENGNHLKCYIKRVSGSTIPYFYILQVKTAVQVNDNSDTKVLLNTYLPIPYSRDYQYDQITGADKIVYNTLGASPWYYKNNYTLYSQNAEIDSSLYSWTSLSGATTADELKYYPTITSDGSLRPVSMYIGGLNQFAAVAYSEEDNSVLWVQPVAIYQDVYSSTMLNAWEGGLNIDEEKNTIMSTMLGAGTKDSSNRFNGVLLGDVKNVADSAASTGLFGYHEGAQSFGFKIDGTAFIGKANRGQIRFDGNSGSIQSLSYSKNKVGMNIDLDDGILEIRGGNLSKVQYRKTINEIQVIDFGDISNIVCYNSNGIVVESNAVISNAINILKELNESILTSDTQFVIEEQLNVLKNNGVAEIVFKEYNVIDDGLTISYSTGENNSITLATYDGEIPIKTIYSSDIVPVYNNNNSYIRLSTTSPYFQIKDTAGNCLINISDKDYYLQSSSYNEETRGVRFDLKNDKLIAYDFILTAYATEEVEGVEYTVNETTTAEDAVSLISGKEEEDSTSTETTTNDGTTGNVQSANITEYSAEIGNTIETTQTNVTSTETKVTGYISINSTTNTPLRLYSYSDSDKSLPKNLFSIDWSGTVNAISLETTSLTSSTGKINNYFFNNGKIYSNSNSNFDSPVGIYISMSEGISVKNGFYLQASTGNLLVGYGYSSSRTSGITLYKNGNLYAGNLASVKTLTVRDTAQFTKSLTSKEGYIAVGGILYGYKGVYAGKSGTSVKSGTYNGRVYGNLFLTGSGDLLMDGDATIKGKATISGNAIIKGNTTINKNLTVDGSITGTIATSNLSGTISGSQIANSAITASKIADSTITASEIANSTITTNKMSSDYPSQTVSFVAQTTAPLLKTAIITLVITNGIITGVNINTGS